MARRQLLRGQQQGAAQRDHCMKPMIQGGMVLDESSMRSAAARCKGCRRKKIIVPAAVDGAVQHSRASDAPDACMLRLRLPTWMAMQHGRWPNCFGCRSQHRKLVQCPEPYSTICCCRSCAPLLCPAPRPPHAPAPPAAPHQDRPQCHSTGSAHFCIYLSQLARWPGQLKRQTPGPGGVMHDDRALWRTARRARFASRLQFPVAHLGAVRLV